jgi:hypothetical protein
MISYYIKKKEKGGGGRRRRRRRRKKEDEKNCCRLFLILDYKYFTSIERSYCMLEHGEG